ncbi:hypothetical protein BDP27DRAFT_1363247 [Rhodocollybia butyracea]|uniref:H-type lectin domain-containing protein n=1 Tax=Rhodocollybia butyracea TaxID=206335 RepID=A0A9P5PT52_9AGAR|nr:hypothetical protein BDP27DRAFT_1363247 [Rhodocollybia butyracea]
MSLESGYYYIRCLRTKNFLTKTDVKPNRPVKTTDNSLATVYVTKTESQYEISELNTANYVGVKFTGKPYSLTWQRTAYKWAIREIAPGIFNIGNPVDNAYWFDGSDDSEQSIILSTLNSDDAYNFEIIAASSSSSDDGTDVVPLDTGVFNSMDVRPWQTPSLQTRGTIKFTNPPLKLTAQAVAGLNWLDFGGTANVRIKTILDDVTNERCSINLQSWGDTLNYSTGVAWLQYPSSDHDNHDFQCGTFNTMEDHDWTKPQKLTACKIVFPCHYTSPPAVIVFLTSMDIGYQKNLRVKTYTTDVQADSFTVHIDSWADTSIWSAGIAWFAYPKDKKNISSGTYSTNDLGHANSPRQVNSNPILFQNPGFDKPPRVFMALNMLDMGHGTNVRVRLSSSHVTKTGMKWHIDTWGDTTMFSAGASYIAF